MFTSMIRGTAWGAAAAITTVLSGCVFDGHLEQETRVLEVAHVDNAPIDVATRNGRVDITADPSVSNVVITARLKARTLERLAATKVVAARDGHGALSVRAVWPDGRSLGNEACGFDIRLPGARGVSVETSNGGVRVSGLEGAADLRTSNGTIVVSHQGGGVIAETSNGEVELTDVGGDVRARSSNGEIEIAGAAGKVEAKTSNGRVKVALVDSAAGPVEARSSNGSVVLELGNSFRGKLRLDTSNGSVRMDETPKGGVPVRVVSMRRRSAVLAVGTEESSGGAAESVADTSNGDIEVRFVSRTGSR